MPDQQLNSNDNVAVPDDTPVIFLMGATACGKTALSISLAQHLDAEIISVDSALIYRGMDVGTAKPTLSERAGIPHHLIDIVEPWHSYSAAQFCDDAVRLIRDIHARGKRVLLVGGTMLYYKALEEGLASLPEADKRIRNALVKQANSRGWQSLHDELHRVDPAAALRIHPNDPQRLQRALEVYRITGTAMSELQANTRSRLGVAPAKFALVPQERVWLHQRIEERFHDMLENGFMGEMKLLHEHPALNADLPAMRSVGYRQAWAYLDSFDDGHRHHLENSSKHGKSPHKAAWVEQAVAATRQLAKRQLTWLRSMSNVTVIECDKLAQQQQFHRIIQALQSSDCRE